MASFEKVNDYVYHLSPFGNGAGGGITLVIGKANFLIDCGASDSVVTGCLVPALKKFGLNLKDIDYVLLTHCHPENIGGAHKLRSLLPADKKVLVHAKQANKLKNPTYYLAKDCNIFPDYDLPFREVRGILPDGLANEENIVIKTFQMVDTSGHSSDCVGWYHNESQTLIAGDAIQCGGTKTTGTAYYNDLKAYKTTLQTIQANYDFNNMVCSDAYFENSCIIKGREKCIEAIQLSYDYTERYESFVDSYLKTNKIKKDKLSMEKLAKTYFNDKEKPESFAYSMITFSEHI